MHIFQLLLQFPRQPRAVITRVTAHFYVDEESKFVKVRAVILYIPINRSIILSAALHIRVFTRNILVPSSQARALGRLDLAAAELLDKMYFLFCFPEAVPGGDFNKKLAYNNSMRDHVRAALVRSVDAGLLNDIWEMVRAPKAQPRAEHRVVVIYMPWPRTHLVTPTAIPELIGSAFGDCVRRVMEGLTARAEDEASNKGV
jgi:hypothetical protein